VGFLFASENSMTRKMKSVLSFVAGIAIFAGAASAQTITHKTLDRDGAKRVITAGIAEAQKRHTTGVIAVVDDGGNLMAVERIDNTFAAGGLISIGKARTAAIFKKPTRFFEDIIKKGRTPMVALNDFTPLQGGVPVEIDGQIVGAVGVSGASSAQEDDELATIAASAVSAVSAAASGPVKQFSADQVADAFAKGAVLFENPEVNYQIHTSQRTQTGQAEVHTRDTDLIRVVAGEATFVTGGTVVSPKPIAADEIRGSEIAGGETRQLRVGDVIIVPHGVPHWFKAVNGTFQYYTIKVRDYPTAAQQSAAAR
jgi:glc operon protein GlcG